VAAQSPLSTATAVRRGIELSVQCVLPLTDRLHDIMTYMT